MNAALVMVVRNEEALIEYNICYHLSVGFNIIAVLDHGSNDQTTRILGRLAKDKRLMVMRNESPVFDHSALSNSLLRQLLECQQADWVFVLDADEFFYSDGGVHCFLERMIDRGVSYGTIPWFNSVMDCQSEISDNSLHNSRFYRPWPERSWQHEGMFRKAFCRVHNKMEIVVGGHYFRKEVNPEFFGDGPSPVLISAEDACIFHHEFRGSVQELVRKWKLFADYECDSSSHPDAPWLERLRQIRLYIDWWEQNPEDFKVYWGTIPRTFWGTPIPLDKIKAYHHISAWMTKHAERTSFPQATVM
jgi:hypothetical protein